MKTQITLLLLILFSVKIMACSCSPKLDFKTKEDLKEYSFIAHIKINGIRAVANANDGSRVYHQMTFKILELYKGKTVDSIFVFGSHYTLPSRQTSCDLGENIGDEWIIFGYYNKKLNRLDTSLCTRSKRIKLFNGYEYENISYPKRLTLKKKLQQIFDKKPIVLKYEGERIEYYENGKKQLQENYVSGILEGKRILWYPNGVIKATQHYTEGNKDGVFEWYSTKGNLIKKEKFSNDISIDTTTVWRSGLYFNNYSNSVDLDLKEVKKLPPKGNVLFKQVFNKKGELTLYIRYYNNGKKESEHIYYPKKRKETVRYFHRNGTLKSEMFKKNGRSIGVYKKWDDDGKLIYYCKYDKKGQRIKKTIRKL